MSDLFVTMLDSFSSVRWFWRTWRRRLILPLSRFLLNRFVDEVLCKDLSFLRQPPIALYPEPILRWSGKIFLGRFSKRAVECWSALGTVTWIIRPISGPSRIITLCCLCFCIYLKKTWRFFLDQQKVCLLAHDSLFWVNNVEDTMGYLYSMTWRRNRIVLSSYTCTWCRFYITSKLANPHYPPEICVKVFPNSKFLADIQKC